MQQQSRDRARLRQTLADAYPWVVDPDVGPGSVAAGECDRCARRPRCVATCGPVAWVALCATCVGEVGDDAWCDGHVDDARRHQRWAADLPSAWPTVVRLWWVATGEARVDEAWVRAARSELAPEVVRALP